MNDKFTWLPGDFKITKKKPPADIAATKALDLDRWERKAIKAIKAGQSADVPFESGAIDDDEKVAIRAALKGAQSRSSVREVFKRDKVDALITENLSEAVAWASEALGV